jgi:Cu/Ag efflux protein CusF
VLRIFFVCIVAVAASLAHAEVIDLEGIVKAVDASARTITIERKTPKGTKTLEFEVTRKAGDLHNVKNGDRIAFSYDPDLELVTKFGDKAIGDPAIRSGKKLARFTVSISETGEVSVGLSQPMDTEGDDPTKSGVVRTKQDDGSWTQSFGFDTPQTMAAFPFARNVSVNDGLLVMKPGKSDKGSYLSSGFSPKGRLRVPLRVDVDVESMQGNALLRLELNGGSVAYSGNHLFFLYNNDGLSKEAVVEVSTGQGDKAEKRLQKETVQLGKEWEKSFRLPIPNAKNNDVYGLLIGAFNQCEVKIRRITITGQPVPLFGMGLDAHGPTVFVKTIVPNSIARKAGIKEGDGVVTINGIKPHSMADALERMASVGFEQPCEIVVVRGGEKRTLTLKAKWEE